MSYYKEAIALWQEYKERDVDCDRLQRIHCLENLAGVLKHHPETRQENPALKEEELIKEVWRCVLDLSIESLSFSLSLLPSLRQRICVLSTARKQRDS